MDIWDVKEKRKFREYMINNIDSWVKFAEDDDKFMPDLVLVTGFHKTSHWACAAFESPDEITCTLELKMASTEAIISATWMDPQPQIARSHSGPRQERDENHPSSPRAATMCVMIPLIGLLAG
jgi:hypothetical protein